MIEFVWLVDMVHKTKVTLTWANKERIKRENAKRARKIKENAKEAQGKGKESEGKDGDRKEQKEGGVKKMRRGMRSLKEIKKKSNEHRTVDKKVTIPEISKRDRAGNEAQSMLSEHHGEGSTRSRQGLPCWATRTGQYVCNACKMSNCDAKGYTVGQTDKGDI